MTCSCKFTKPVDGVASDTPSAPLPDRYVSFLGLDCDAKARRLMDYIRRHIDEPGRSNAFWDYFKKKAVGGSGPRPDELFLVHSNLNQIRELLEERGDDEALALLDRIEEECC